MALLKGGDRITANGTDIGAAGCLVYFADHPERLLLLTAGHVTVSATAQQGDRICVADGSGTEIGTLRTWTSLDGNPTVDAALVWVNPDLVSSEINGFGVPKGENINPQEGDVWQLSPSPSTPGNRTIIVDQLNQSVDFMLDRPGASDKAQYQGQILGKRMNVAPGDSGSMVLDSTGALVGMLVAMLEDVGTKDDNLAIPVITPISAILDPLNWQGGQLKTVRGGVVLPDPVGPVVGQTAAQTSLSSAALTTVAPGIDPNVWLPALNAAFVKYEVTTNKRMAAAIGQFLVEAGLGFQNLIEDLTYTHPERIVAVFPDEIPTVAAAAAYVGQPEALANFVYANSLGNGDEASGDGYRFRGRGLIQLTHRNTYSDFGGTIGMTAEEAAAYCETPAGAAMSGCWYLSAHGCLPLADTWDIASITRRVNGRAMRGADQRVASSNAMLAALGG